MPRFAPPFPRVRLLCLTLLLGPLASIQAEVRLPAIFGDHMVLQQEKTIPVWGTAAAGEAVTVTLGTISARTVATPDGKWRVDLPPQPSATDPLIMTVKGTNLLRFEDVLLGDVWLGSGQSNMGFPMKDSHVASTDIPKSTDAQLRLFIVGRRPIGVPQTELAGGRWELCDPATVARFSAVTYYFGRELRQSLRRPIGLLTTSWGGTPAQAWISYDGLKKQPELTRYRDSYQQVQDRASKITPEMIASFDAKIDAWKTDNDARLADWKKAADAAKSAGLPVPPEPKSAPMPANPNPFHAGFPSTPTCLFNGMVAPLIPYAIKGVLWYQGESNTGQAHDYHLLLSTLINDWRTHWRTGDFPFLFVQLANCGAPEKENWVAIREAQLKTLSLPATGMACTIDIGADNYNFHPQNKRDVGLRLAKAAHQVAYGENVVGSGPLYETMKVEGSSIRISFKAASVGGGLKTGSPPAWSENGQRAQPDPVLRGFQIAGADQKFVPAQAVIENNTVRVFSDTVSAPVSVRYGWLNAPKVNLYNQENLPASPFRTDTWDTATR